VSRRLWQHGASAPRLCPAPHHPPGRCKAWHSVCPEPAPARPRPQPPGIPAACARLCPCLGPPERSGARRRARALPTSLRPRSTSMTCSARSLPSASSSACSAASASGVSPRRRVPASGLRERRSADRRFQKQNAACRRFQQRSVCAAATHVSQPCTLCQHARLEQDNSITRQGPEMKAHAARSASHGALSGCHVALRQ